MTRLFYVPHAWDTQLPFKQSKEICNRMGGQYMQSVYRTKKQSSIPGGFIFRTEEEAKAFQVEIQKLAEAKVVQ